MSGNREREGGEPVCDSKLHAQLVCSDTAVAYSMMDHVHFFLFIVCSSICW